MMRRLLALLLAASTALAPVVPAQAAGPADRADSGRAPVNPEWAGRLKTLFQSPEFAEEMRPEIAGVWRIADLDNPGVLINFARTLERLNLYDFSGDTPEAHRVQSRLFKAAYEEQSHPASPPLEIIGPSGSQPLVERAADVARSLSASMTGADVELTAAVGRAKGQFPITRQRVVERFVGLGSERQAALLLRAPAERRMGLIRMLPFKAAAELLRQVPPDKREELKSLLDEDTLHEVNALLAYAEDEPRRDRRFAGLYHPDMTAGEAITYLHQLIRDKKVETIREAYLLDGGNRLLGVVDYYDLIQADPSAKLSLVARRLEENEKLRADASQDQIVRFFLRHKTQRAPLLDAEDRVVGVTMAKDVLHVMKNEWDEDFVKMVGARLKGLLFETSLYMAKVRSPWLIVTFALEFFVVANIITFLSGGLSAIALVHLNAYIPVIAAMGGNVGAQTASAIVRGLATGEVEQAGGQWTVVRKEVSAGMILGLGFGLVSAVFATVVNSYFGVYLGWRFATVVGGGMFISMTAAALMGSLEPFLFQRMGIDPATATGPLITTFTDIVSNAFYFALALLLLS